jgi:hypothetical protein
MERRSFVKFMLPAMLAGALLGEKKEDRLSGIVKTIDAAKMTIEMAPSNSPRSVRKIVWDANTKFTLDGKPSQADVAKDGMHVVALGKFDGLDLKATLISFKHR